MVRRTLILALVCGLLSGCSGGFGESRVNPFNWFTTNDTPERLATLDDRRQDDPRPLVSRVTSLTLDRTPGGVIVRATGLPPSQGYYDTGLLLIDARGEPVDGVLAFTFRAVPPLTASGVGPPRSRELTVARFITRQELQGVSSIRVAGAENILATRP